MGAEKRWRLVCYDVRDPKRYRKLFKIIRGAGESVQYSVFRCRLDDLQTERLRWRLSEVMAPEDSLLIVDLCPSCSHKVITRNHVQGWSEEPDSFRIVGTSGSALRRKRDESVQASEAVDAADDASRSDRPTGLGPADE
jgi:CRISPR-associated protein Cas2